MDIISRKQAKQQNLPRYFTGQPCKYGHMAERKTRNCECIECASNYSNKRYTTDDEYRQRRLNRKSEHPEQVMLNRAKSRANKKGIPFDLSVKDIVIPDVCPMLGIPLVIQDGRATMNSPSLDRIVPALGYIKGNIHVISNKANTIKNDATIEDLRKILNYLDSIQSD